MSKSRHLFGALLIALGCALAFAPGAAWAQKSDARASAEFTARTSVQTIYQNLINSGYEWDYIRDEKMPDILVRSVEAIQQQTSGYDRSLILGTFLPTYIRTFYDEIDKLNAEHNQRCMTVKFVEVTFVPFVQACSKSFSGKYSVRDIAGPVLQATYSYTVCERPTCLTRISKMYNSAFKEQRSEKEFSNVCASGS